MKFILGPMMQAKFLSCKTINLSNFQVQGYNHNSHESSKLYLFLKIHTRNPCFFYFFHGNSKLQCNSSQIKVFNDLKLSQNQQGYGLIQGRYFKIQKCPQPKINKFSLPLFYGGHSLISAHPYIVIKKGGWGRLNDYGTM